MTFTSAEPLSLTVGSLLELDNTVVLRNNYLCKLWI